MSVLIFSDVLGLYQRARETMSQREAIEHVATLLHVDVETIESLVESLKNEKASEADQAIDAVV